MKLLNLFLRENSSTILVKTERKRWKQGMPQAEYDWFVRPLLNLGTEAEVLAPDTLRHLMRQAALDSARRYAV
jgi:predicted DNA-binding transcriptional regulator YafY